jgi:hypothetical protein
LAALAARGEGHARRSLDGVVGVCLDMASIASSFLNSVLNVPTLNDITNARHNNSLNRSAIELVFHRQLVRSRVVCAPG